MPIFKFSCSTCGHSFAELVRWGFGNTVPCPRCGNEHPERRRVEFSCISVEGPSKKDEDIEPITQVA